MRVLHVIVSLVLLAAGPLIAAEEGEPPQPLEPRLLVSVITSPLSPSLSTVSFDLPFSVLPWGRPWNRAGASIWVLSDSPYLIPHSYVEFGLVLEWAFIDTSRHKLMAGLGTAAAIQTLQHSVSIPLIMRMNYRYAVLRWLSLEATAEALLYGQGAGFVLHLRALNRPFAVGFIFGFGIGYGFLSEWDFNPHGDAFQLDLAVGYSWRRSGKARQ
jgi:hypothetical protein